MINILIGIATILVYALICYVYCYFSNGRHFDLKVYTCRKTYRDIFSWLWATILILLWLLDILGKAVQYMIGKLF